MLKRSVSLMLVFAVLLGCAATASAAEPRAYDVQPTLSFVGTIAVCSVTVRSVGEKAAALALCFLHKLIAVHILPLQQ